MKTLAIPKTNTTNATSAVDVNAFWRNWFHIHSGRDVGYPERFHCPNENEFLSFINRCKTRNLPCYMSVQPFKKRMKIMGLEKLFFDFDCKDNLKKAFNEAQDFAYTLINYYDVKPLLIFSGRKGYHIYVWLWNLIQIKESEEAVLKKIYRLLQEKLIMGTHYETLDSTPMGDIKRLARVPYSIHEKTGKQCHPISTTGEPLILTSLDSYRQRGLSEAVFTQVCREVQAKENAKKSYRGTARKMRNLRTPILSLIEKGKNEHNLSHLENLAILFECIANGRTDEEIHDLFKQIFKDEYNERQTQYTISHARRRGYKPFKISTLKGMNKPSFHRHQEFNTKG